MRDGGTLAGKTALIFGVATDRSLAFAIARALRADGARLAFGYQSEPFARRVRTLGEELGCDFVHPCDVRNDAEIDAIFQEADRRWGHVDFVIHSVAHARREDLAARFLQCSREGFLEAVEVSAFSLVALARRAEPLMRGRGGVILTITASGSHRVIPGYGMMGAAKATLESCVRYLAWDLGGGGIRVNAISPAPVKTLAAVGIPEFPAILEKMKWRCPLREVITAEDVGAMAAFLCGPGGRHLTGTVFHVDSGDHVMGSF